MLSQAVFLKRIAVVCAALLALALIQPACLADVADPATGVVSDYIIGHNNKGPYTLSYTNPVADSIVAVINGRMLKRGSEFNVDAAKGIMSFTSTLLKDAIVKVSYRITPGKSQRTAGTVNVPVTLDVFSRKDANLQVTGVYAQDDPSNTDAGKTIVGVKGEKTWGGSKVTSQFLMSQHNDASNENDGGSWDRAAYRVGTETGSGPFKFSGSYLAVGEKFAGEKEYGLTAGRHAADLAVRFAPSKAVKPAPA